MRAQLEAVHPVLMARDLAAAIEFYKRLGFTVVFCDQSDAPTYAGLRRDQVEIHLQWHDGHGWPQRADRPTYRFVVPEVDALHAEFRAALPAFDGTDVRDTPWGTREFHLRDPDHNGLQFYRAV